MQRANVALCTNYQNNKIMNEKKQAVNSNTKKERYEAPFVACVSVVLERVIADSKSKQYVSEEWDPDIEVTTDGQTDEDGFILLK
jgi:hypothetical protein